MRELSFLNQGIRIAITDERAGKSHDFQYKGGILEFVQYLNQNKNVLNPRPILFECQKDDIQVELAFQYNSSYNDNIFTFVNNINTHEGGTHLIGFKSALTRCLNSYAESHNLLKDLGSSSLSRRRRPRGPDRGPQRQDARPPVRGPDQDQAGQLRGQGHRRVAGQRAAGRLPRGEPDQRQADHAQGPGRGPGPRSRPQGPRNGPPQERARKLLPAGQAGRLPGARPGPGRDLPGRGRFRRRLGQAGPRPPLPGHPAAQGQDPERLEGPPGQDLQQRGDRIHGRRPGHLHRRDGVEPRQASLPQGHHHDRRRRGRVAHPDPADDLLLPPHEVADRKGLRLHRPAAALQDHPRAAKSCISRRSGLTRSGSSRRSPRTSRSGSRATRRFSRARSSASSSSGSCRRRATSSFWSARTTPSS